MPMFEPREYADMIAMYGACDYTANKAAKEYAYRFPNRHHPDATTIQRAYQRVVETGSVIPSYVDSGSKKQISAKKESQILQGFIDDPTMSLRSAAKKYDTNCRTVQLLKEELDDSDED